MPRRRRMNARCRCRSSIRPLAESATGQAISSYGEAPELAEMVAAGTLPAVEERLPAEPIVVQPEEAIGKYGGTLRKVITGQVPRAEVGNWWLAESLIVHSPQGEIIPTWPRAGNGPTTTKSSR
ncbi:MAG: hypothetical protein R2856_22990 [Caldilineaceae bacterium]